MQQPPLSHPQRWVRTPELCGHRVLRVTGMHQEETINRLEQSAPSSQLCCKIHQGHRPNLVNRSYH